MELKLIVIMVCACMFVLVLLFVVLNRRKKKETFVVIGEQFAKAVQAEKRRKEMGDTVRSPVPNQEYSSEPWDPGLINPVQNSLDSTLRELCQRFAKSHAAARETIRTSISMNEFHTLLAFSRRAAVFAVREQNMEWVVQGLTAIAMIERERTDFRDILLTLSLLYHSGLRIGADADQLFRNAATLSEDGVSELILRFIKRPANERDLRSSWGYEEIETKDGFGFISWDFKKYDPGYDLKNIVVDIAKFVATDKYLAISVSVASEIPRVWLESDNYAAFDQSLQQVRAGASVHARLRPNEHVSHLNQMLLVFIVELQDESAAQRLLELFQKIRNSKHSMVGLKERDLFCLVVASSTALGVESFETTATLARFSEGIAEILRRYENSAERSVI